MVSILKFMCVRACVSESAWCTRASVACTTLPSASVKIANIAGTEGRIAKPKESRRTCTIRVQYLLRLENVDCVATSHPDLFTCAHDTSNRQSA